MPVLIEADHDRARSLAAALPPGAQVVPSADQLENWLLGHTEEYVVVLGPEIPMDLAAQVAHRVRLTHPSTGTVLVRDQLSTETFTAAMSAGLSTVVAADDAVGISAAVERHRLTWEAINGAQSADAHEGRIITVFSPKGGVGKTTLSVNLALALSGQGAKRVCIVDLDLAFGDVAITLQLVPQHTIDEAIGTEETLDISLLDTLLTRHEDGLSLLAAPTSPEAKDRIEGDLVRRLLAILRANFDFVIVDTAPAFDTQVLEALDETDEIVLVATLDVPTIKNLKIAVETLDTLSLVMDRRYLVLNRADEEVGLSVDQVADLMKMPVTAALPTSLAVANGTNHGRPILLGKPDHPVSKAIQALSQQMLGVQQGDDGGSRRRRLFGRRRELASA